MSAAPPNVPGRLRAFPAFAQLVEPRASNARKPTVPKKRTLGLLCARPARSLCYMAAKDHKELILILAREFASMLATPVFLADGSGQLAFYNAAAEVILGKKFSEAGSFAAEEWAALFKTEALDGTPMPLETLPSGVAFLERRPAHGELRITGLDGVQRELAVTAFPLLTGQEKLAGVVAIFWTDDEGGAAAHST